MTGYKIKNNTIIGGNKAISITKPKKCIMKDNTIVGGSKTITLGC